MIKIRQFLSDSKEKTTEVKVPVGDVLDSIKLKGSMAHQVLLQLIKTLLDDMASYDGVPLDGVKALIYIHTKNKTCVIEDGLVLCGYNISRFKLAMVTLRYVTHDTHLLDQWVSKNLDAMELGFGENVIDNLILSNVSMSHGREFIGNINSLAPINILEKCSVNSYSILLEIDKLLECSDLFYINNLKVSMREVLPTIAIDNIKVHGRYTADTDYLVGLLLLTRFGLDRVIILNYIKDCNEPKVTHNLLTMEKEILNRLA